MKINFDPRLDRGDGQNMLQDIIDGNKLQTIRKKPIPTGTNLQLWANWRGMKKGLYCENCWEYWGKKGETDNGVACRCQPDVILEEYPQKLRDAVALEPIPINLQCDVSAQVLMVKLSVETDNRFGIFWGNPDDFLRSSQEYVWDIIGGETALFDPHPFAKADSFKTNKAMIDWAATYLEEGWNQMWINPWELKEGEQV